MRRSASANGSANGEAGMVPFGSVPSWVTQMRDAAQKCITTEDIEAIVNAQVERAKKGDEKAIKFVFEQVLGGSAMKGATFVQNNFAGDPVSPAKDRAGSKSKIDRMAERAAAGLPLHQDGDFEPDLD